MKTNFIFEETTGKNDTRKWSEPDEYGESKYIAPTCPEGVDPADYDDDMLKSVISGVLKDEYDPFSKSLYPYEPKYMHAELYYDDKNGDKPLGVSSFYTVGGPVLTGGLLDMYHRDEAVVAKNTVDVEMHFASSDTTITLSFTAAHINTNDHESDYDCWQIDVSGHYSNPKGRYFGVFSMNASETPFCDGSENVDRIIGTITYDHEKFSSALYDANGKQYGRTSGEFATAWTKILAERVIDICHRAFID